MFSVFARLWEEDGQDVAEYAVMLAVILAVVVGCTIVAVGGGGIVPMRAQWERFFARVAQEAPQVRAEAANARQRIAAKKEEWKAEAEAALHSAEPENGPQERPRFQT